MPERQRRCYSFYDTGKCRFGDSCRFAHGDKLGRKDNKQTSNSRLWDKAMMTNEEAELVDEKILLPELSMRTRDVRRGAGFILTCDTASTTHLTGDAQMADLFKGGPGGLSHEQVRLSYCAAG